MEYIFEVIVICFTAYECLGMYFNYKIKIKNSEQTYILKTDEKKEEAR